jgi:[protein-PII] uridylyltransferase
LANVTLQTQVIAQTHQVSLVTIDQIDAWRARIKAQYAFIKSDFALNASPKRLFNAHSSFADVLLADIWHTLNVNQNNTLIAVGGYGRGELYPYSDIDLLILTHENITSDSTSSENKQSDVEAFIGVLWDIGLNVGHSVRNLAECMTEAHNDITVQTNLIESRLLVGKQSHYQAFAVSVANAIDLGTFFKAKIQEQDNRYTKYNDSAYSLEPNIKESPGGLRDLHTVLWLTRALQLSETQQSNVPTLPNPRESFLLVLQHHNLISLHEKRQILRHQQNLQRLRIRLHFLSNRREDRLLFDYQNALANDLGYVNTSRKRASEQLMQSYYRSVKFISLMNEILVKSLQTYALDNKPIVISINNDFEAHNHYLEVKNASVLAENPSTILEAFLIWQTNTQLKGMGPTLLRNMQRVKKLVNRDFRQNPFNRKLFIAILSQPNGVNHILRAMNRYGILGCYIPAFGKIIGQMQHDLFHVYTVDDHILNVLANLRRFAKPDLKHEFPLCTQLFAKFDAPHILYLAALFHDIAKGRGGDHSMLGTLDARRFCQAHYLPKADIELVAWLVEAHLKMSSTAQKLDLADPEVITQFAHFVKNERRLTALYLLTVADIRGTSPTVWNAWKARLLESLFYATTNALKDTKTYSDVMIHERKVTASAKLAHYDLHLSAYQHLWQQLGEQYFSRYESNEIAWHSRLLTPHLHTLHTIVRARLSPHGEGIQIMIYTKDRSDLFARICNFFDRMAYTIVEAKIFTTHHGYALDSFIVLDTSGSAVSYQGLLKFIEVELTHKIETSNPLEAPLKGRISRQVKHMPIQTNIAITKNSESYQHQLNVIASDKPGLLATLAHILLNNGIVLHNAKINTLGNRAEDTFLISGANNHVLSDDMIADLKKSLTSEI